MTEEEIKEAKYVLRNTAWMGTDNGEKVFDAIKIATEALENCPPKDSLCYGCHDNCKKCEIMGMAMI